MDFRFQFVETSKQTHKETPQNHEKQPLKNEITSKKNQTLVRNRIGLKFH